MCEPYRGGVEVCDDVLSDVGYVFITKSHGSQENISHFLETNIPHSLLTDDNCRELVFQLICHYYLIPCGSEGSELPPSSICHEECSMVENTCPTAWQVLRQGLRDYKFISCEDTSAFLYPLPNCCTGVGIVVVQGLGCNSQYPTVCDILPSIHTEPNTSSESDISGAVAGPIMGFLVLVAIVLFVVLVLLYLQWKRKKKLENLRLDVIAKYDSVLYIAGTWMQLGL